MKQLPDLNNNRMTPRLFLLMCLYSFMVGLFMALAGVVIFL